MEKNKIVIKYYYFHLSKTHKILTFIAYLIINKKTIIYE